MTMKNKYAKRAHPRKLFGYFKSSRALKKLRQFNLNEVVIVNGWASYGHWSYVKSFFTGYKVIVVRESPQIFLGPDRNQSLLDLLKGFASFDYLIFVSEKVCHQWRQYQELVSKPYSVLPNCCEEEEVLICASQRKDTLRLKLGFNPDDFIIICPGYVEHLKGQDLLLDVVPELKKEIPNLKVVFIGNPTTKWGSELIKIMSNDLYRRDVTYLPAKPEILSFLRAADLLAFPSRAEAMPRTILEAMVMKTPTVASDVGGIPELIFDGTTGLLFQSEDREGLLNSILRLHADNDLRKRISEAASERYWSNYSRRHQFMKMKKVLKEIKVSSSIDFND
ncbi:MAG: glycosyltransferase family 4 protein [Desulfuromonadales bacterium]